LKSKLFKKSFNGYRGHERAYLGMYMRKNHGGADGMVCVSIYTCNNHYDCHDTVYDEVCNV
jgi:hypothetical protein